MRRRFVRFALAVCVVAALGGAVYGGAQLVTWARLQHVFATTMAAQLCAGIFVSGRDWADIDRQSFVKDGIRTRIYDALTPALDRSEQRVTVTGFFVGTVEARFEANRGCTLQPSGAGVAIGATGEVLGRPATPSRPVEPMRWETRGLIPDGVDADRIDAAIAANFADPAHQTHAFLVYHRGVLVREVYAAGGGPSFSAESWSLGKTIVGVLAGRLMAAGKLSLDEPIALPHWPAGDPRRAIRVRDLLQMASGLAFTTEGTFWPVFAQSDHGLIYTDLLDVVAFSANRPLERAPATKGNYNNADALLLLAHIRHKLGLEAEGLRVLIRDEVLTPLGMRHVTLSTDPQGMPVITGYVTGAARDWGRMGVMLGAGGRYEGDLFLSPEFVRFMAEPSPNYPDRAYGATVWLNHHSYYAAPKTAIVMSGAGDQVVLIVPEKQLVIVRMGHLAKAKTMFKTFNATLSEITAAFPDSG